MFKLFEVKRWSSHAAREKAWKQFASGYPGGAIDLFRLVGMDECEIVLSDGYGALSNAEQVGEIDHRQRQARTRISISRRALASNAFPDSARRVAQSIHEDEGIIMGLERLRCLITKTLPDYVWEAVIDGPYIEGEV